MSCDDGKIVSNLDEEDEVYQFQIEKDLLQLTDGLKFYPGASSSENMFMMAGHKVFKLENKVG
jgi:hypothetical protein